MKCYFDPDEPSNSFGILRCGIFWQQTTAKDIAVNYIICYKL